MFYQNKKILVVAALLAGIFSVNKADADGMPTRPASSPNLALRFSTTGRAGTWKPSVSVKTGDKLFVQFAYDNRGTVALRDASIYSSLPAGFRLVPGTTQNCITPSASETICNTAPGQGGPIDESQIWNSESCISVAPDIGLFDTPTGARSGLLDIGKVAFLNFVKCSYVNIRNGNTDNVFGFSPGNRARAASGCGAGTGEIALRTANSAVYPTNIVAKSFVNLQICDYINWAVNGGNTDEAVKTVPANLPLFLSCGQFANPSIQYRPEHSSVQTAYHRGFRYLTFLDGQYENRTTGNTDDALELKAAQTPLIGMPFGEGQGNIRLSRERSLVQNIDLLDRSRAKGYIQFQVVSPSTPRRYPMSAVLTNSTDASVREAIASITVNRRSSRPCSACSR